MLASLLVSNSNLKIRETLKLLMCANISPSTKKNTKKVADFFTFRFCDFGTLLEGGRCNYIHFFLFHSARSKTRPGHGIDVFVCPSVCVSVCHFRSIDL